jgi:putative transposase
VSKPVPTVLGPVHNERNGRRLCRFVRILAEGLAMVRRLLRDDQWERLAPHLPGTAGDRGVTARDHRLFIEALLWLARTGARWRDLPQELGPWHTVDMRFRRWSDKGVFGRLLTAVADAPDLEAVLLDASIVRAHPHASGAPKTMARRRSGAAAGG